jgi:quinolinate synthase
MLLGHHHQRDRSSRSLGLSLDDCVVQDPWQPDGGLADQHLRDARVILWSGHCSVHARFLPDERIGSSTTPCASARR